MATSGWPAARSAARTGTPARSIISRTLVNTSSEDRLNASRSKSPAARWVSTENSGRPCWRSSRARSVQGAYVRSATASSRSLRIS
jgi:hypothetical protein